MSTSVVNNGRPIDETVHAKLASYVTTDTKVVIDSADRIDPERTTTSNFSISLGDGIRDVVGVQVVSLVMPNPLMTVSSFNDKFVLRSGFGCRRADSEVVLTLERKNYNERDLIDYTRGDTANMASNVYNVATMAFPYGMRFTSTLPSDLSQGELTFATTLSLFPFIIDSKASTSCRLFGYNDVAKDEYSPLSPLYDWSNIAVANKVDYLPSLYQPNGSPLIGNNYLYGSHGVMARSSGAGAYLENSSVSLKGSLKPIGKFSDYFTSTFFAGFISPRKYASGSAYTTYPLMRLRRSLISSTDSSPMYSGSSIPSMPWYNTHYGNSFTSTGMLYPVNTIAPYGEPEQLREYVLPITGSVTNDTLVGLTGTSYSMTCISPIISASTVWLTAADPISTDKVTQPLFGGGWMVTKSVNRSGGATPSLSLMNVYSLPTSFRRDLSASPNTAFPASTALTKATTAPFVFTLDISPNTYYGEPGTTMDYYGTNAFTSTMMADVPYGPQPTGTSIPGACSDLNFTPRHQARTSLAPGSCVCLDAVTIDIDASSPLVTSRMNSALAAERLTLKDVNWAMYDDSTGVYGVLPQLYYNVTGADNRINLEERLYTDPDTNRVLKFTRTLNKVRTVVIYNTWDVMTFTETYTSTNGGAATSTTVVTNAFKYVFFRTSKGLWYSKLTAAEAEVVDRRTILLNPATVVVQLDSIVSPPGYFKMVQVPLAFKTSDDTTPTGYPLLLRECTAVPNSSTSVTVNSVVYPTGTDMRFLVTQGYISVSGTNFVICEFTRPINTNVLITKPLMHSNTPSITGKDMTLAASLKENVVRDAFHCVYLSPWKVTVIDRWSALKFWHKSHNTTGTVNSAYIVQVYHLNVNTATVYQSSLAIGNTTADIALTKALAPTVAVVNTYNKFNHPTPLVFLPTDVVAGDTTVSFRSFIQNASALVYKLPSVDPFALNRVKLPLHRGREALARKLVATGVCHLVKEQWVTLPSGLALVNSVAPLRYYLELVGADGVSNAFSTSTTDMVGYVDWQYSSLINADIPIADTDLVGLPKTIRAGDGDPVPRTSSALGTYWDQCIQFHDNIYSPVAPYEKGVRSIRRVRIEIDASELPSNAAIRYPCVQLASSPSFGERHELTEVYSTLVKDFSLGTATINTADLTTVAGDFSGTQGGVIYGYPRLECHFTVWPSTERGTSRLTVLVPKSVDIRSSFYGDADSSDDYGCNTFLPLFAGKHLQLTQSPRYMNLIPTKRLALRCPEIESLINVNNTSQASVAGIAMFAVNAPSRVYNTAEGSAIFLAAGRNFHPVSSLKTITLRVENERSEQVDMRGLDYYFILNITHLVPDSNLLNIREFDFYTEDKTAISDVLLDEVYDARKKSSCASTGTGSCNTLMMHKELDNERNAYAKFNDVLDRIFSSELRGGPARDLPVAMSGDVKATHRALETTPHLMERTVPVASKVIPSVN